MKESLKNNIGLSRKFIGVRSVQSVIQNARVFLGLDRKYEGSLGRKLEIFNDDDASVAYMACRHVDESAVDLRFYSEAQVTQALANVEPIAKSCVVFTTVESFDHVASNNFVIYEHDGIKKAAEYFVRCSKDRGVGFYGLEPSGVQPRAFPCYVSFALSRPGRVEVTSAMPIGEMQAVLNMVRTNIEV